MVYNGFESRIFPLPNQPIVLAESEKSSSSEHSSDYYEYFSPEEKILERGLKLVTP